MVERNFDGRNAAQEVFITSATSIVTAVTQIDDQKLPMEKLAG